MGKRKKKERKRQKDMTGMNSKEERASETASAFEKLRKSTMIKYNRESVRINTDKLCLVRVLAVQSSYGGFVLTVMILSFGFWRSSSPYANTL